MSGAVALHSNITGSTAIDTGDSIVGTALKSKLG
jgi:hypothetical protein